MASMRALVLLLLASGFSLVPGAESAPSASPAASAPLPGQPTPDHPATTPHTGPTPSVHTSGIADPLQCLGAHPVLAARLNDVPRSLTRFATSPYATVADTPWGHRLLSHVRGHSGVPGSDLTALATSLQRGAVALDYDQSGSGISWAVSTADVLPLRHWCEALLGRHESQGQLTEFGSILAFHASGPPSASGPANPARHPEACLELTIDPGRVLGFLGLPPETGIGARPSPLPWSVAVSLDAIGIREQWDIPVRHPGIWKELTLPHAHADLLAALPGDTLAACTCTVDGERAVEAFSASGLADRPIVLLAADLLLAHVGLPGALDLMSGLHGDCIAWIEQGTPSPTGTVVAGMDQRLARQVMRVLARQVGMTPGPDGTLIGFLGVSPFQVSYQDGRLVMTTHPSGISGCLDQPAGFLTHQDAAAAVAELPADAMLVAVSRTGPAAAAFARLALMPLAHAGMPELSTLPHDVEIRGRHGFLAVCARPMGIHLVAGGFFGGPFSTYLALGSAAVMTYESVIQRLPHLEDPPRATGTSIPESRGM